MASLTKSLPGDIYHLPETHSAIIGSGNDSFIITNDMACPRPVTNELLVRTEAVAINPTDVKMIGDYHVSGAVLGLDFAGVLVASGPETAGNWKLGDRILGSSFGMNKLAPGHGAFADHVIIDENLAIRIPENMSFAEGASLMTGMVTIGLVLRSLNLPTPFQPAEKPNTVLVYGASTASGTIAIQLLRLSNLVPIAICSPHNFDLVQSYGAEAVFDYHSPSCATDVRAYTKNNLAYAIDCITSVESTSCCYAAIGRAGGRYVSLEPFPDFVVNRRAVSPTWVLALLAFGKEVAWPAPYEQPADPEAKAFTAQHMAEMQVLLDDKKLRTHPLRILQGGGWQTVLEGRELLKSGGISGQKIVVNLR